jgi:hypothetical protein
VPQRLVEIRTVLFGNLVDDLVAQPRPRGGGDRIEIADDGLRAQARSHRRIRTAIDRHQKRRDARARFRSSVPIAPPPTSVTAVSPEDGLFRWLFLVLHGDNLHRMALFPSRSFGINLERAAAK